MDKIELIKAVKEELKKSNLNVSKYDLFENLSVRTLKFPKKLNDKTGVIYELNKNSIESINDNTFSVSYKYFKEKQEKTLTFNIVLEVSYSLFKGFVLEIDYIEIKI